MTEKISVDKNHFMPTHANLVQFVNILWMWILFVTALHYDMFITSICINNAARFEMLINLHTQNRNYLLFKMPHTKFTCALIGWHFKYCTRWQWMNNLSTLCQYNHLYSRCMLCWSLTLICTLLNIEDSITVIHCGIRVSIKILVYIIISCNGFNDVWRLNLNCLAWSKVWWAKRVL